MTPQRWAQIRQIFDDALEKPQRERGAYLGTACAGDGELRREVESLLASHDESKEFLATPAADLNQVMLGMESSGTIPRVPRVGPYLLEKRIGSGGMGSVWLAFRSDQEFEKKVAVKMVRRGMDSAEILRRFRMERQLLAGLDHPNIARLIDGGSTPEGLPYLVMEYVEGTRIDQFCERHKSTISERLTMFRSVCAAVQYAHSNLVVHRDIKAGNILVTKDGTPKLLDFGIAKLIPTEFSPEAAAETRPELRPMTLEYASPEQVRGESITTASDVYSLGVLLYKLLTNKFPFSGPDTQSRMGMQQAICEKEPPRPSSVILSDAHSAVPEPTQKFEITLEETREKARRRLKRKLSGDLDMISLKALRKEPARRYLSAEQFSEDVRRYLEGRPVRARGDTLGYRTLKFVQRNAAGVSAMTAVLALFLAGTVWLAVTARRTEAQLKSARDRELALAPDLIRAYDRLGEPRRAVETARAFLTTHPERADVRRDLGLAEIKLGDQEPGEAEALYRDALAQFELLTKQNPATGVQTDVLSALRKLGLAQYATGNLVDALISFSRALQLAEGLPQTPDLRRTEAACTLEMGEVLAANHEPEVAVGTLRKALDLYRELAGSTQNVPVKERTPAGYELALKQVAAAAPADLHDEMSAELQRMQK